MQCREQLHELLCLVLELVDAFPKISAIDPSKMRTTNWMILVARAEAETLNGRGYARHAIGH